MSGGAGAGYNGSCFGSCMISSDVQTGLLYRGSFRLRKKEMFLAGVFQSL